MKTLFIMIAYIALSLTSDSTIPPCDKCYDNEDFQIKSATITRNKELGITVWEMKVKGKAGATTPKGVGKLNGAPVLGYVFPTTLKPGDVGFSDTEGIVALALTSHPDFDDTPMWDENFDRNFSNDGVIWHPHWVVLNEDKRVGGGLSVKQFKKGDPKVTLPANNPGMEMYMDSPGYNVVTKENSIRVIVPDYRISNKTDFKFDAVACYMMVDTGDAPAGEAMGSGDKPMLGVYKVYSVASGNLSLPYTVK
ncbi:hypothetical protein FMM05_02440 [Flavobacterium zepuense]|uniref:Uncharacterized protein n=1 Tax=Flavobacterium zepuense TaxID=2593302 RepID=A0A552VAY3_9FLAO|nr:hypothetical protein [Flavobacterium zepuense]TRW27520.1 hypothetical protein FMM05_02440 [Flavobacterium zepuense]